MGKISDEDHSNQNVSVLHEKDKKLPQKITNLIEKINTDKKSQRYHSYGNICFKSKKNIASIKWFGKAIALDNKKPEYFVNRALAYNELRKHQEAVDDLNEAIKLDDKNPQHFADRGVMHYKLKNFKEVIDDLSKAIARDDKKLQYYYLLGVAHYKLKEYQKVIEVCNKATNIIFDKIILQLDEYLTEFNKLVEHSKKELAQLSQNQNNMLNSSNDDKPNGKKFSPT